VTWFASVINFICLVKGMNPSGVGVKCLHVNAQTHFSCVTACVSYKSIMIHEFCVFLRMNFVCWCLVVFLMQTNECGEWWQPAILFWCGPLCIQISSHYISIYNDMTDHMCTPPRRVYMCVCAYTVYSNTVYS